MNSMIARIDRKVAIGIVNAAIKQTENETAIRAWKIIKKDLKEYMELGTPKELDDALATMSL